MDEGVGIRLRSGIRTLQVVQVILATANLETATSIYTSFYEVTGDLG